MKGVTGIGLPLVAVPVMSLVIDISFAVALMPMAILLSNIRQIFVSRMIKHSFKRYWPVIVMIPIGTLIGVSVLANASASTLRLIIGIIVVVFSTVTSFQPVWRLPPSKEKFVAPFTGLTSGVIGGIASFFAPPLIMYLLALNVDKDEFVGGIGLMYLTGGIVMIIGLLLFGIIGLVGLGWSALAALPVLAGQHVGSMIRAYVNEQMFKRVVIALLFVAGLNLVRTGLV